MRYHPGELEVQQRAGVERQADRVSDIIRSTIPAVAQLFLQEQRMLVVSSLDHRRRSWASVLTSNEAFLNIPNDHSMEIHAMPVEGDPLADNLHCTSELGLLAIEFYTRRRVKMKGKQELVAPGFLRFRPERVYALCPNYIQTRWFEARPQSGQQKPLIIRSNYLSSAQQIWIREADTFFIATFHPQTGADASHRGGKAGFVRVLDCRRVLFPDYPGNKMFNTLGNITAHPSAGLLFIDFDNGHTLQLTGRAEIWWDNERLREFPGAERLVYFEIQDAVQINHWIPFLWHPGKVGRFEEDRRR